MRNKKTKKTKVTVRKPAKKVAKKKAVKRKPVAAIVNGEKSVTLKDQLNECHKLGSDLMTLTEQLNNSTRKIGGPDEIIEFAPIPEPKNVFDEVTLIKNRMQDLVSALAKVEHNLRNVIG